MTKKKQSAAPWQAQLVAEAFCRADGQDPHFEVFCTTCSVKHQLWERRLIEAERFVAGYDALKKVQKENLS